MGRVLKKMNKKDRPGKENMEKGSEMEYVWGNFHGQEGDR